MKKGEIQSLKIDGAGSRNRTGTGLLPQDFKSCASTCSAMPARKTVFIKVNISKDRPVRIQGEIRRELG
jgi:hypothetical protein